MTAFGHCLRCNVTCIDAAAWRVHELEFHKPNGEQVCLMCGKAFLRDLFVWHVCVDKVFGSGRHPSNGRTA